MRRPRQGLGSTRGTAAVHRRSDIALRGPALACAALVFFLPVVAPLASPQLLSAIYDGQKLEERHQGKLQVLDSVVVPATDCSISRPCWPIVTGAEQVHPMIESRHSLKLLYRLTPGMRGVTNIGGTSRQLLKTSLIDVLFAIDPQTFFFFYISGERLERANPNMPRESAWPRRGARSGPGGGRRPGRGTRPRAAHAGRRPLGGLRRDASLRRGGSPGRGPSGDALRAYNAERLKRERERGAR